MNGARPGDQKEFFSHSSLSLKKSLSFSSNAELKSSFSWQAKVSAQNDIDKVAEFEIIE
jgi:hypothetical protein